MLVEFHDPAADERVVTVRGEPDVDVAADDRGGRPVVVRVGLGRVGRADPA